MSKKSIFINGSFYTSNSNRRFEAMAVIDGVISELGNNTKIKPLARRGYRVYDLKKRFVVPGMIDSHLHMLYLGDLFNEVNLDGLDSIAKIVAKLTKASKSLKPNQWLLGRGWNKNLWGGEFPDKHILDSITNNPIALESNDAHLSWVNSVALKKAGINRRTINPNGGEIERDSKGEATGILKEYAVNLIHDVIPRNSKSDNMNSLLAAQKHLLKLGITGVGDFGNCPALLDEYDELTHSGKLKLRIAKMVYPDSLENAIKNKLYSGYGSDRARIGSLKLFADGALGSQTALMFKPYKGSNNNYGISTIKSRDLNRLVSTAVKSNISVAIHAIGDKANAIALETFERYDSQITKYGLRSRIEHAQLLKRVNFKQFKSNNIIASVQPIHAPSDRDTADRYWGARARYAYPFKSLLENGVTLAFGSDAPIETANPMAGIHAAVTRKRAGEKRSSWYPEEKISVSQAIKAYTSGSAKACYFDDITGTLEVGKKADFVVLSDDLFKIKRDDIHKVSAVSTVINGVPVNGAGNLK